MDATAPTPDLIEAQEIVEELTRIDHTFDQADRLFVESWNLYLSKAGDRARVGRFRLMRLRQIAAFHGVQVNPRVEIRDGGFEVVSDVIIS